jgi:hypothetical protein
MDEDSSERNCLATNLRKLYRFQKARSIYESEGLFRFNRVSLCNLILTNSLVVVWGRPYIIAA